MLMASVGKARWLPGGQPGDQGVGASRPTSRPGEGPGRVQWPRPVVPSVMLCNEASRKLPRTKGFGELLDGQPRGDLGGAVCPQSRPCAPLPPGCPEHTLLEETAVWKSTSAGGGGNLWNLLGATGPQTSNSSETVMPGPGQPRTGKRSPTEPCRGGGGLAKIHKTGCLGGSVG